MTLRVSGSKTDNQLLQHLSDDDRDALLGEASAVQLSAGCTFSRISDPISKVYFPQSGVLTVVTELATGHHLSVAAVGAEGMIGLAALYGSRHRVTTTVLVESHGLQLAAQRFLQLFHEREGVRRAILAHMGQRAMELMTAVACNRAHSHRQRLARWLLLTTDKARQPSLRVTHEALAQMVGGPRHAVTTALNDLGTRGAIAHHRGRVEVIDRRVLVAQSCECYATFSPAPAP